jgi:DUF2905 family protein
MDTPIKQAAVFLILTGGLIIVVGILMLFSDKIPFLGKLPGDLSIKRDNFSFYFPITTCILISLIITLIFWLIGRR